MHFYRLPLLLPQICIDLPRIPHNPSSIVDHMALWDVSR
jgi:hypothetical protein